MSAMSESEELHHQTSNMEFCFEKRKFYQEREKKQLKKPMGALNLERRSQERSQYIYQNHEDDMGTYTAYSIVIQ